MYRLLLTNIPDFIPNSGPERHELYINLKSQVQSKIDFTDEEFEQTIKMLYLLNYIRYNVTSDFNEDLPTEIEKRFDPTVVWRYNLKWLYKNRKELFDLNTPNERNEIISKHYSADNIYRKIAKYGSVLNLLKHCYLNITDEGLHFVHANSIKNVQEATIKSSELLGSLNAEISTQKAINTKFDDAVKTQNKKVNRFYEEISTILGLLLAAFSFIGLNISIIPKIDDGFVSKVLIINLSLIVVLIVLFGIIKFLIFDTIKKNQLIGWIISLFVSMVCLLTIVVFLSPKEEERTFKRYKNEEIKTQKKYEDKIENLKDVSEKQKVDIDNLKEDIDRLERNQDKISN